jgi:hypothetical protein
MCTSPLVKKINSSRVIDRCSPKYLASIEEEVEEVIGEPIALRQWPVVNV